MKPIGRIPEAIDKAASQAIEALSPLLKKERLKATPVRGAIVLYTPTGTIISVPVFSTARMGGERKTPRHVGIIATNATLIDPRSKKTISPGVYLVSIRGETDRQRVFDYLDHEGDTLLSARAVRVRGDHKRPQPEPNDSSQMIIDGVIHFNGSIRICVSFLFWKHCWDVWEKPEPLPHIP